MITPAETAQSAAWFVFHMLLVISYSAYSQIKEENKNAK